MVATRAPVFKSLVQAERGCCCGLLVVLCPSNMLAYVRDGSAQTVVLLGKLSGTGGIQSQELPPLRWTPGAGIMETNDHQVTTVFAVQPSFHHGHPNIMKRYHRLRTCSHTSPRHSPMMVTLHDTRFVECHWWNDGWAVETVVT